MSSSTLITELVAAEQQLLLFTDKRQLCEANNAEKDKNRGSTVYYK
jgi:hypothetical protein